MNIVINSKIKMTRSQLVDEETIVVLHSSILFDFIIVLIYF